GGALVVVGADTLDRHQLAESMASLDNVGARILGVVLNRSSRSQSDAYSYYDYAPTGHGDAGVRKHTGAGIRKKLSSRPTRTRDADAVPVAGRMDDADHESSVGSVLSAADGGLQGATASATRAPSGRPSSSTG